MQVQIRLQKIKTFSTSYSEVKKRKNSYCTFSHISGYWPFGEFLCFATVYGQCVCIIVSSCTLVVIGFERWVAFSLKLGNTVKNLL